MMETVPLRKRNAIRTAVSDHRPSTGLPTSKTPAAMPMIAEASDHPMPGA